VQNYALNFYAVYRVPIIKRKINNKCGMEIELRDMMSADYMMGL